ncbi:MAG: nitroreductase family protein [Candidatus Diapherotrites archaeon]|uniref:Nitroreductase family protein n=1 Tax=Candidatus Iainarchaeum sp. TaxID=3101447 RepID=A0A8T4L3G3_9ARCH|nr:nitroreductase family protein [Candidatus Diapherotrites archaeon]
MELESLFSRRRTIRKFKQKQIPKKILFSCIDAGRLAPSARNQQSLEYVLVTRNVMKVFSCTSWATYAPAAGPKQGEEPAAFIVVVSKRSEQNEYSLIDCGIAAGHIVLAAYSHGIASCILGSIDRDQLSAELNLPTDYVIHVVICLGFAAQKSVVDDWKPGARYWVDEKNTVHVPKRKLSEILHEEKF